MFKLGKYLQLQAPTYSKSGKTKIWKVLTADGERLGLIKWFPRWRQYAYEPAYRTVYNSTCLHELAEYCALATKKHRAKP